MRAQAAPRRSFEMLLNKQISSAQLQQYILYTDDDDDDGLCE